MGQKEKLVERLKAKPKTFTFDDAEALLRYFVQAIQQGQNERFKGDVRFRRASADLAAQAASAEGTA